MLWCVVCTWPDTTHDVEVLSRYMRNPGNVHWHAIKWVLSCLQGTSFIKLFCQHGDVELKGFLDVDLGGDINSAISTTGHVYLVGGRTMSWLSQLHKVVMFSTTEVGYIAIMEIQ